MKAKVRILGFVAVLVAVLLIVDLASAATVTADSCSDTDVQDAIDTAMDGDTVEIPAGSCTWTSQVITPTTKRLDIVGAGIDVTVITPNVTPRGLHIQPKANEVTSLSHMTFTGGAVSNHVVGIWSANGRFHVHNVEFDLIGAPTAIQVGHRSLADPTYGLIDHSTFTDTDRKKAVDVVGQDATWTTAPQDFGTIDAVYFEDNHVEMDEGATGTGFVNSSDGARVVVRYNTLVNVFYGTHGDCTGGDESTLLNEIYENDFTLNAGELTQFILIRGGTGIAYNNTMTGTPNSNPMIMSNYDSCMESCQNGLCGGYPCDQQVGRTANQVLSPWYEWDNLHGGANMDMAVNGLCMAEEDHVQAGRDFINDTEMMGYTPFTYPHPYIDDVGLSIDVSDSVGVVDDDVFDLDTELLLAQAGPSPTARSVTPEIFGAIGDGTTDDTAALQAAIDFASPLATTVYLARGTYAISAALQMRSNVMLIGESQASTVIKQTDESEHVIKVAIEDPLTTVSNVEIAHLTLTHDSDNYDATGASAIMGGLNTAAWGNTEDIYIHHVTMRDIVAQGIKAWNNPIRWRVESCVTRRTGREGIFFVGGEHHSIRGCDIRYTGDDGIAINASSGHVQILDTFIDGAGSVSGALGGRGINTNSDDLLIQGVTILNSHNAAIRLTESNSGGHVPSNITIDGCHLDTITGPNAPHNNMIIVSGWTGTLSISNCHINAWDSGESVVEDAVDIFGGQGTARFIMTDTVVRQSDSVLSIGNGTTTAIMRGVSASYTSDAVVFGDGNTPSIVIIDGFEAEGDGGADSIVDFDAVTTGTTVGFMQLSGIVSRNATGPMLNVPNGHAITRLHLGLNDIPDHSAEVSDPGTGIVSTESIDTTVAP